MYPHTLNFESSRKPVQTVITEIFVQLFVYRPQGAVTIDDRLVTQIRKPEPAWAGPWYPARYPSQMVYPILQLIDLLFDSKLCPDSIKL